MAATAPQSRSPSSPLAAWLAARPVWLVAVLATLAAAVVAESFTLLARGAGVEMVAAGVGEDEAVAIPVGGVARSVVLWSLLGIALAVLLDHLARRAVRGTGRPARVFAVCAGTFTILSLAGPGLAPHTAGTTQAVLVCTHLLAGAVIIPVVARRLSFL
ncbi:DUF6069 family protein [Streptomyces sp. WMMC500]|uniref:DUF6069 family protein n=1 Tax=Streptomyces sp. WMMC500 TaxID=3015154 RepID=UPI00248D1B2B|nr:DUF6069 family protein [Streptomyces sp. WMMC500]WBB62420.1 DUF6069 family protein [Streptomyces sp. WMMC500]